MTDFFKITCHSTSLADKFGLCENASKPCSYLEENQDDTWLTTVLNPDKTERRFIPVRNCLVVDATYDNITDFCTGIIIFTDNLVFTEVKNSDLGFKVWLRVGTVLLKNTIKVFKNNHNIENYQTRVAYLAHRKKRLVPTVNNALKNKFVKETGIQLYISHEVSV